MSLKNVLFKEPKSAYPETGGQKKAHIMTLARDVDQAIREGRHEQRSTDRWYMGIFGALGIGAVTFYTNGAFSDDGIASIVASILLVLLIGTLWILDKDYQFWENSDRYEVLNLIQDELVAHTSRALWHRKKQRGVLGVSVEPGKLSREAHSKRMVKENRLRVVFFKPVMFLVISLVLISFIF